MAKKLKPVEEPVAAETPPFEEVPVAAADGAVPIEDAPGSFVAEQPGAAADTDSQLSADTRESIEPLFDEPAPAEPLQASIEPGGESPAGVTSDDRGEPGGHRLVVAGMADAAPLLKRDPGSCVNCGQVGFPIQTVRAGVYQCSQCRHVWTAKDELAPFRRGLNLK